MASSSEAMQHARAWVLIAHFDVAVHSLLVNIVTNQVFPKSIDKYFDDRASFLAKFMSGLDLVT
jgi:hypothetical protein